MEKTPGLTYDGKEIYSNTDISKEFNFSSAEELEQFIEQDIEKYFGIPNVDIDGSIKPGPVHVFVGNEVDILVDKLVGKVAHFFYDDESKKKQLLSRIRYVAKKASGKTYRVGGPVNQ